MAQPMRKLLFAAAGGLLASLMIGTISAAAEEYDIQDSIRHLNSFIVTDSGNRVLTGSCEADQITESGWFVSDDDSLYYYYSDGSCAHDETTLNDGYTYLFASDGALRTGWQTVDGKRYYYSAEVGQPVFGWMDYPWAKKYVNADKAGLALIVFLVFIIPSVGAQFGYNWNWFGAYLIKTSKFLISALLM